MDGPGSTRYSKGLYGFDVSGSPAPNALEISRSTFDV